MKEDEIDIAKEIEDITGIDASHLMKIGLLTLKAARKWLVRELYFRKIDDKRTYGDIKLELSVKYDVSVSTIEKLVYRRGLVNEVNKVND